MAELNEDTTVEIPLRNLVALGCRLGDGDNSVHYVGHSDHDS